MQQYTIVKTLEMGSAFRHGCSDFDTAHRIFNRWVDRGHYTDVIEMLYDDEMIRWSRGALGSPKPIVRVTGGVA